MRETKIIKHKLGKITAIYTIVDKTMQFAIVPSNKSRIVCDDKLTLQNVKFNNPDSAVQVHVFGDNYNRQYSAGQTMRNSQSCYQLKFIGQKKLKTESGYEIISYLKREDGQSAEHHVLYRNTLNLFEVYTVYCNDSKKEIILEMLSSFSLGSLTPFALNNPSGKINIFRMRSQWSAEAKLEILNAEDLLLEPSWMNYGVRGERFGSIGSMPSKKYMPLIGLCDKEKKVTWAISMDASSSWQMEYYLAQNSVNLSGGIADYEFGHWRKSLQIGERIETPHAYMTAINGDIDEACQVLTQIQFLNKVPASEDDLPIIYNEYCCNWGKCSKENLLPLINAAAKFGVKYFVIDAGWSDRFIDKNGQNWTVKKDYYPNGLEEVVQIIYNNSMVAGIWFEPESHDFDENCDESTLPLLKRNGKVIHNLERVFINMENESVKKGVSKGVIDFLGEKGFGYIKIDYNENIGIGCDGYESLGEGLRQQILATQSFFKKMINKYPDLVFECCSSGGMRCEPSFIKLCSMMSFSDIHYTNEEPIVACDMQRVLHPKKSQIWATLNPSYSIQKIYYTLACGFYGRLCLSGQIDKLNEKQSEIIYKAVALYKKCADIISNGFSYFIGKTPYHNNLIGYHGIIRFSNDNKKAMIVLHSFDQDKIEVNNRYLKNFDIEEVFAYENIKVIKNNSKLIFTDMNEQDGLVVLLKVKK